MHRVRFGVLAGLVAVAALAVPVARTTSGATAHATITGSSQVVIAHVDTGINPYAAVFRDDSAQALEHPSTYIPGYPTGAEALPLHLNEADWQHAFALDKPVWDGLLADWNRDPIAFSKRLFWIPGTKIIGSRRQATGGTFCPPADRVQPAPNAVGSGCTDYPLLDDHGHGTMTANRMGGNQGSLCPQCRIVSVEGLGAASVDWIAKAGWIDVQSNSWASLTPQATDRVQHGVGTGPFVFERAARSMAVYFATGNGLGGAAGFAPCPSEEMGTLAPSVIWVGAHDNGHVTAWSCAPAHVVADGYAGLATRNRTIDDFGPNPFACCTSAAAPYAAGEGAAIVLEARRLLGHGPATGVHDGVIATGDAAGAGITAGPLADGVFTLDELRTLVKHSAEARPDAGVDDGWINWTGEPRLANPTIDLLPYGPGANPYCPGCNTLPVAWSDVPAGAPAYASIGYGATNERSLATAIAVMRGDLVMPARADVDDFFTTEGTVRQILRGND